MARRADAHATRLRLHRIAYNAAAKASPETQPFIRMNSTPTNASEAIATLQQGRRKLISPAAGILGCLWALALLVLFALGPEARTEAWQDLVIPIVLVGLLGVTHWLGRAPAEDFPPPDEPRSRVCVQLVVIGAVILLTAFQYLLRGGIPVWSTLAGAFSRIGSHTPAGSLGAVNFGQYALLPGIAVILLGAQVRQLGLRRFESSTLRVALAWLLLPLLALAYATYLVARMHKAAWFILSLFVQNFFLNGISEEFLWRGLLMTRLRKFLRDDWANFVQAILFGAWHFRYDYASAHAHLTYAVSAMIASQMVFGYVMGCLLLKTKNLAIPAIFHATFDTVGSVFT